MGKSDKKSAPRPTAASQSPVPTSDPSMLSIKIPVETEKKLLAFVSTHLCDGSENELQRVSRVRLQNQYAQMIDAGFTHEQVAAAMKATLGGGIGAALDYLCLTLPHEQLPLKFTDKSYVEELTGVSAVINAAVKQEAAVAGGNPMPNSAATIETAPTIQRVHQSSEADIAAKADAEREERRRWIARYESAQSDDDGDDDPILMPSGKQRDVPKTRKEVTSAYTAITEKLQALLIAARQSKSAK